MYLAVEKCNRLKVFTLQNILCFNGNILNLKESGFCALRLQPFFLSVLFLLTFFRSYSELLSKFGEISFQDYVSQGITHPVFYGDLVYKLRRVKGEANFISSGSKIVKRLRRRQYDPAIIERTIGLVLGPFTALYRSFLKRCTLTNKAVGTI